MRGAVLAHVNERFSVARGIDAALEDPRIAIYFDGATQASQLPPQRQVPGHENQQRERQREQLRVSCLEMGTLVREDRGLLSARRGCHPKGQDDARTQEPDDRGPHFVGDEYRHAGNHGRLPAAHAQCQVHETAREDQQQGCRHTNPQSAQQPIEVAQPRGRFCGGRDPARGGHGLYDRLVQYDAFPRDLRANYIR